MLIPANQPANALILPYAACASLVNLGNTSVEGLDQFHANLVELDASFFVFPRFFLILLDIGEEQG